MIDAPRPHAQGEVTGVVHRNIAALLAVRDEFERRKRPQERIADAITRFAGSMWSVWTHGLLYGGWIVANSGLIPGVRPWDPFPFVMLAMAASVEAIFLSTFILISQNRMQALADKRSELDVQINLLAEHEITRLLQLVDAIARKVGVEQRDPALDELTRDVPPETVMREIEAAEERRRG